MLLFYDFMSSNLIRIWPKSKHYQNFIEERVKGGFLGRKHAHFEWSKSDGLFDLCANSVPGREKAVYLQGKEKRIDDDD